MTTSTPVGERMRMQMISEERTDSVSDKEVSPYKSASIYEMWRRREAALEIIPKMQMPLDDIVVWIDPLDATQVQCKRHQTKRGNLCRSSPKISHNMSL